MGRSTWLVRKNRSNPTRSGTGHVFWPAAIHGPVTGHDFWLKTRSNLKTRSKAKNPSNRPPPAPYSYEFWLFEFCLLEPVKTQEVQHLASVDKYRQKQICCYLMRYLRSAQTFLRFRFILEYRVKNIKTCVLLARWVWIDGRECWFRANNYGLNLRGNWWFIQ
jgi:hypothetical protein